MKYLNIPVAYLTNDDFDGNGNLTNPNIPKDKPVLIMIQAGFCGHCTRAKPAFQEFAKKNKDKVFVATIEGDGSQPGEPELGEKISDFIPGFRGFPEYVLYEGGKFSKKHEGGRKVEDLEAFVGL